MTFTISSSSHGRSEEVELSPKTIRAIRSKAKEGGLTAAEYIKFLIERDILADKTFDEILKPIRDDIAASGLTPEALDGIVDRARKSFRPKKRVR